MNANAPCLLCKQCVMCIMIIAEMGDCQAKRNRFQLTLHKGAALCHFHQFLLQDEDLILLSSSRKKEGLPG